MLRGDAMGQLYYTSLPAPTRWNEAQQSFQREQNEGIPNILGLQKVDGTQNPQTLTLNWGGKRLGSNLVGKGPKRK